MIPRPRDVTCLSSSSDEAEKANALKEISRLSSSSASGCVSVRRRRRKQSRRQVGSGHGARLQDEGQLRQRLSRRCRGCRRNCLQPFLQPGFFEQLLSFRKRYAALHKTDQDNLAAWRICS